MNDNFNVLLLNDLCSYGKASLTVSIPVLSHFGIKVSPLISVILSNHTAFESFCAFDLTQQLEKIVEELKIRKPDFDAFYVGWIASGKQPSIVVDIIKSFNIGIILIDPILGDNGKLYPSMSDEHVNSMKELMKYADIATPNITELAILLGKDPSLKYNEEEVKDMAKELAEIGPKTVIVTSVVKDDKIGCLCFENNNIITSYYPKINIDIKDKGCLIIANHPSLLDVVFLIAHIPGDNLLGGAALGDAQGQILSVLFYYGVVQPGDFPGNVVCEAVLPGGEVVLDFAQAVLCSLLIRELEHCNLFGGSSAAYVHIRLQNIVYTVEFGDHFAFYRAEFVYKLHLLHQLFRQCLGVYLLR